MHQPLRPLHPSETPAYFTVEEFQQLAECDALNGPEKIELVEGVIVTAPLNLSIDSYYQRQIWLALDDVFGEEPGGRVTYSPATLHLGPATLRAADVAVMTALDLERDYPDVSTVLLAVEIAATTRERDLESKRVDYARAGIPHYWVVDTVARVTHVMSDPRDGDYAHRPDPIPFGSPIAVPETDREIVID